MRSLLCFIFSIILFSCEKEDTTQVIFIDIDTSDIVCDYSGLTKSIAVKANCDWKVSEVPEWCLIDRGTDENQQNMIIEVLPNNTLLPRECTIHLSYGDIDKHISINQECFPKDNSLRWHTFPVNTFSKISYITENNTNGYYELKGESIFISPSCRSVVYTGQLLDNQSGDILRLSVNDNYTFYPITVSAISGRKFLDKEYIPSYQNHIEFVREFLSDGTLQQNLTFVFEDTPIQYNSYEHLNLLGRGNLGVALEEIVSGKPYSELELGNRTGLVYSYCHKIFSVDMDMQRELIREQVSSEEAENLSYINSVVYGKTAFLVVETDYNYDFSQRVIRKVMRNAEMDKEEASAFQSFDLYYLYFDNNGDMRKIEGGEEIISLFLEQRLPEIMPLSFSLDRLSDHSVDSYKYKVFLGIKQ